MRTGATPEVALAPLEASDLPLVACWLEAEHVRRTWGDPEENLRLLASPAPGTSRALVVAGVDKVGLVQWQHPTRTELDEAGLVDIPSSVVDVDIMIGEPAMTGRGIGPAAIELVAARAGRRRCTVPDRVCRGR